MRCGAKAWGSWAEALADHRTFLAAWPRILGAYVGPWSLGALQIEAMMITINSVNQCTFCSGLHCELGRMAGIPQPLRLNQATRWITTKEEHAKQIITTVSEYMLCQRVKREQFKDRAEYLHALELHHALMQAAMKVKQTTDESACDALEHAIGHLQAMYTQH